MFKRRHLLNAYGPVPSWLIYECISNWLKVWLQNMDGPTDMLVQDDNDAQRHWNVKNLIQHYKSRSIEEENEFAKIHHSKWTSLPRVVYKSKL